MNDSGMTRPLTGWQRAYVLAAAQYVRELILKTPGDTHARSVYEGLLEVLEPTRRVARQHREQREHPKASGSMWEPRSGRERRQGDRRRVDLGRPAGADRRKTQRRSGHDRRQP